jgi:hypothetical protein
METWREAWEWPEDAGRQPDVFNIRREIQRKKLRLRAFQLLEFAWGLFLLGFSYWVARSYPSTEMLLWALYIWILTFFASGFSIWNWRLLWNAEARTTHDYAQLYEKYCIAGLRYIRFGYVLLALNLAVVIPLISWMFFRFGGSGRFSLMRYLLCLGLAGGLSAGYLIWFSVARRNRYRELEQLRQYRGTLEEEQ